MALSSNTSELNELGCEVESEMHGSAGDSGQCHGTAQGVDHELEVGEPLQPLTTTLLPNTAHPSKQKGRKKKLGDDVPMDNFVNASSRGYKCRRELVLKFFELKGAKLGKSLCFQIYGTALKLIQNSHLSHRPS